MQRNGKILIVTGGRVEEEFAAAYLRDRNFDRIIAADSGLASCRALHLTPTDILGDFDSLKEENLLTFYKEQGVPVREFPTRKDYTDTELAVEYARELSPEEVILLGATGTRLDHALANIGMLEKLAAGHISGKIVDKHNEIEMLCGQNEKKYKKQPDRPFFFADGLGRLSDRHRPDRFFLSPCQRKPAAFPELRHQQRAGRRMGNPADENRETAGDKVGGLVNLHAAYRRLLSQKTSH